MTRKEAEKTGTTDETINNNNNNNKKKKLTKSSMLIHVCYQGARTIYRIPPFESSLDVFGTDLHDLQICEENKSENF